MTIQTDLPNMPEEVVDIWLKPLSERNDTGWPPSKQNSWRYILGKERDLAYLQSLTWKMKEMELKPDLFLKQDLEIVIDLFKSYVLGEQTEYSLFMTDGKERFDRCCSYLKEHGVFPRPVILEDIDSGVHIFDGYHRISAFFYLYGYFRVESVEIPCLKVDSKQKVWLATRSGLVGYLGTP
jgi:hypothetical protein